MIKFEITQKDLSCLGYPMDMQKEIYIAYYNWIKDNKPVTEFKYTLERSLEYVDAFNEKYKEI